MMGFQARLKQASAGVTLIEISVVLAVLAIFTTFAILSFGDLDESRDATAVQTVQASLQGMVAQAAERLGVGADTLDQSNIINALQMPAAGSITMTALGGARYHLDMPQNNREAIFTVDTRGNVTLESLSGFSRYEINNDGVIQKSGS